MAKLTDRRFGFFFLIGSGACVAVGADDNDYDGEPNYCFRFFKCIVYLQRFRLLLFPQFFFSLNVT